MTKQAPAGPDLDDSGEDVGDLHDVRVRRMDGVRKAANGTSFFFSKSAEGGGLLSADLVRQLLAKDDGSADPGSPEWEAADATSAQAAIEAAGKLHDQIKALTAREATEVGAGHLDDISDVLDLSGACDALVCVLSTLAAFAAREQLEAGDMTKAGSTTDADPAHAVHDTMSALAQSHNCPACQGFLAAAKAHDTTPEPPADATDGPAAATTDKGTAPAIPMENTMTDATGADTTQTTPAVPAEDAKQSKKAKKLAKSAAQEAVAEQLAPVVELLTKQQATIDELAKGLAAVSAQPQPTGLMMNGAVPGAVQPAPAHRGDAAAQGQNGESAELTAMRKAADEETDPRRKKGKQQQALLKGLDEVFSQRPTVRP